MKQHNNSINIAAIDYITVVLTLPMQFNLIKARKDKRAPLL